MSMWLSKSGLIILNAWYGKFVTDNSRRHERAKVIDVTVPLQCLVKDSKLILTEATKVSPFNVLKTSKPTQYDFTNDTDYMFNSSLDSLASMTPVWGRRRA